MRTIAPLMVAAILGIGCSDDSELGSVAGGAAGVGGGAKATGGNRATGGRASAGQAGGGASAGTSSTVAKGGSTATGGNATGGANAEGGASTDVGGTSAAAGADPGSGGANATGGVAGETSVAGGSAAGGAGATAGATDGIAGTAGTPAGGGTAGTTYQGGAGASGSTPTAGMAGTAGTSGSYVPNPGCGALRESVVGWWSFEESLASHAEGGTSLVPVPDTATPGYTAGIASGRALDVAVGSIAEVGDIALNVTGALTLSAFVKGTSPDGRLIDRITAGGTDGYLLDFQGGQLRFIVDSRWLQSTSTFGSPSAFTHVAGVFTGGSSPEIRLYVDGVLVDHVSVTAGDIPTNSLTLRIGADRNGNNRFTGQIDEPMVFSRALTDAEILSLRNQLVNGECPVPVANCPARGLLLEHDPSGVVQSGSLECVRANIRRAGDLRVLSGDTLQSCDWNGMTATSASSCQTWVPFASIAMTGDYFAPVVPLEWRLFKFNTTGLLDQIATRIETYGLTLHEQSSASIAWFGRDWRIQRYATDNLGNGSSGSLQALAEHVRAGAGMGVYVSGWNYSLPHFTAIVPLTGDHFAGQDPWHISSDYGSIPGETVFQGVSYHYATWLDTLGFYYASRWDFGSPNTISDSSGTDAMAFVTEPGWTELLAHDASGTATAGSLQSLKDANLGGAALRVGAPEGFFDCSRTQVGSQVGCITHDSYSPASTGNGHLMFDGSRTRMLRLFTTAGRALRENWSDHTANLASSSDDPTALRWFVRAAGWSRALETNAGGSVVSGSIANIVAAVQNGADVAVMADGNERIRCESLRIGSNPTRAACLALPQTLRGMTASTSDPGYYEARVYNTNGMVASARVAFGSTTTTDEVAPTQALVWFVRYE